MRYVKVHVLTTKTRTCRARLRVKCNGSTGWKELKVETEKKYPSHSLKRKHRIRFISCLSASRFLPHLLHNLFWTAPLKKLASRSEMEFAGARGPLQNENNMVKWFHLNCRFSVNVGAGNGAWKVVVYCADRFHLRAEFILPGFYCPWTLLLLLIAYIFSGNRLHPLVDVFKSIRFIMLSSKYFYCDFLPLVFHYIYYQNLTYWYIL